MKFSFINTIRALAIILVIAIHIATPALSGPINADWWISNVIDGFSRIGVPLFLMISGALLLHKDEPVGLFFKKRFTKILIPFLFWSIFYYLYRASGNANVISFVKDLLSNNIMYHLWYFYIIIPLYLLIPLLRKVIKHIPLNYILAYSLIASSIVTLNGLLDLIDFRLLVYANPFSGGLAYLLLGYAITHKDFKIKFINVYAIISVLVIIFGTYILTDYTGMFSGILYEAFGLPVAAYAVAVFMFIKEKYKDATTNSWFISQVSTHSFGIYLLHPIVLIIVTNYIQKLSLFAGGGILSYIVAFIATLVISLLAVMILSKIKFVKKIV